LPDKKALHPNGTHEIFFEEESHTYTDNFCKKYLSGTSIVGKFFPEFDKVAVAKKCSAGVNPKYTGRTWQDIIDEWEKEADRGRSEGTNAHEYAEGKISGWPVDMIPGPISERCEMLFDQVDIAVSRLLRHFVFVAAEMIVFDPETGLSGMIDLVMYDRISNDIMVLDWKQNKKISRENNFQSGLGALSHLQDTDISHYSLQLSLYEKLLVKGNYFPNVSGYRRGLIHLMPDGLEFIPIENYDYEVEEMIKLHMSDKEKK